MTDDLHITRRLGTTPAQRGSGSGMNCPWVGLLDDEGADSDSLDDMVGVIGRDITEERRDRLPAGVSLGPGERLVAVPRRLLIDAIPQIAWCAPARVATVREGGCGA